MNNTFVFMAAPFVIIKNTIKALKIGVISDFLTL
jgi:hypothetical protein